MRTDAFVERHIGPNEEEIKKMLATIGVTSIKKLLEETIPKTCLLYTSPSPRDVEESRMPSSA